MSPFGPSWNKIKRFVGYRARPAKSETGGEEKVLPKSNHCFGTFTYPEQEPTYITTETGIHAYRAYNLSSWKWSGPNHESDFHNYEKGMMQIGTHHSLADLTNICSVQVEDVQWLQTALAQEIHNALVHWCISSMHIQPELSTMIDRGVAKPITPAKHGKHIFLPHLPSQNISVCLGWQGSKEGGHTHTHKQRQ